MERGGAAVMCDGRLFHRRAAATGNALSPTVDRRVRRTSRNVDEAERSRHLAGVSAGRCNMDYSYEWSIHCHYVQFERLLETDFFGC